MRVDMKCPGHFIGASECHFFRNTYVSGADGHGGWIVSSVGDYRPMGADTPMKEIGFLRFFETFVFLAGPAEFECCPFRATNWTEVSTRGYATAEEAEKGHEEMVAIWEGRGNEALPEWRESQVADFEERLAASLEPATQDGEQP